jgi:hypothetical protein
VIWLGVALGVMAMRARIIACDLRASVLYTPVTWGPGFMQLASLRPDVRPGWCAVLWIPPGAPWGMGNNEARTRGPAPSTARATERRPRGSGTRWRDVGRRSDGSDSDRFCLGQPPDRAQSGESLPAEVGGQVTPPPQGRLLIAAKSRRRAPETCASSDPNGHLCTNTGFVLPLELLSRTFDMSTAHDRFALRERPEQL